MSSWSNWKREERTRMEPGDYRVEIVDVEERESRAGNPMLVVSVRPNGSKITIKHYIVQNEYFNRNMTEFFDSFNIADGDFNFITWKGAVGAARLKEDENGYLRVGWFIHQNRAESLPPWQGQMPERVTLTELADSFEEIDDDDVPFA